MVIQRRVDQFGYHRSRKEVLHTGTVIHTMMLVDTQSTTLLSVRTGTLEPGDVLLAIDGKSLGGATLHHAVKLLKATTDIVTLQISKDAATLGPPGSIVFTVELVRRGASLGITVHGKYTPIFFSYF